MLVNDRPVNKMCPLTLVSKQKLSISTDLCNGKWCHVLIISICLTLENHLACLKNRLLVCFCTPLSPIHVPVLKLCFHLVIFQDNLGGHPKHLTSWCTSAVLHIHKLGRKINLSFVTTYVDLGRKVPVAPAPVLLKTLQLTPFAQHKCNF